MRESAECFGFATGLGHDIRTHLNIVMGAVAMLETERLKPQQTKEYIGMIKQNAMTMLRLVNHLLKCKMDMPEPEAETENSDMQIDGLLHSIAEGIKPYAASHALEFLHDIQTPLFAHCHREMLSRVLYNLLSNAIKCTEPGGFVYLSAKQSGGHILINVADTGCGLSDAKKAWLSSQEPSNTEMGMGLRLVKTMVAQMEGDISFTSREQVGTTFYLQIPAALAMDTQEAMAAKHPKAERPQATAFVTVQG